MDKINARVLLLMQKLGKSKSEIAREIDVSPAIITHITSGRNKVGLDVLQKICLHYPDVSPSWLLNGLGQMFVETNERKVQELKIELNSIKQQAEALEASIAVLNRSITKSIDML